MNELKERIVGRKKMSPSEYLKFLRKSHKIISLEVVGMNLLIMNEPYRKKTISIK